MDLFLSLPQHIFDKISYLKQDYIGLNFDFNILFNFILGLIFSFGLITVSYLLGKKILNALFKKNDSESNYLVDIAIGYIAIAMGITLLGFFSILNSLAISIYLISLLLLSFYPYNNLYSLWQKFYQSLNKTINDIGKNKMVLIWVGLFVFLALINLINPEIREDQYHVDFPKMYLSQQSIMTPSKEQLHVSASPLLSEMSYLIGIFIWSEESARYLHFIFYLLVILTLFKFSEIKGYKFSIYAPLLFATAPVVMHETSSMYVDFQWIFYFLLSILIILKNKQISYSNVALSGILLGGMISSKLWTIIFIPVFMIYLIIILNKVLFIKKIKYLSIFLFSLLSISLIWFLRAFILTGNPLFPAFANQIDLGGNSFYVPLSKLIGINFALINPINILNVFSPLFFLGCILFLYKFKENVRTLIELNLFKLVLLLLMIYFFINYPYGRYLLGIYILLIFFASIGIERTIAKFKVVDSLFNFILFIFFFYYFINSLLIIPYSLGYANKNNYLTRILSKDNSSYYDFNHKFDKYISKDDNIATYGIFGYYYAHFRYIDINYIFDVNHKDFNDLKKEGLTKLFIKGGDINYFCKKLELKNCNTESYSYISNYMGSQPYYLYSIK